MITEIDYDTIKSNNFYKVSYYLRSVDGDNDIENLQRQIITQYNCIFKNIGTDDKCIIESDICDKIVELEKIYRKMVSRYITLFYNKKYNSFMFRYNDKYLYDKFLTHFLNKNNLLNEKEDYNTIILNNEDDGTHFTIQYEESIFDIIETQAKERVRYIRYKDAPITYQQSIFKYYNLLDSVRSLYFFDLSDKEYLPDRLIDNILTGEVPENASIIDEMIIKHFNNEYESIYNINVDRLNWYRIGYTIYDFRKIPILLYLLRYNIHKFLSM